MRLLCLVLLALTIVNLAALTDTHATAPIFTTSEYDPLPEPSAWGSKDEAGNSNTQTAKKVLEAVKLIRTGEKYVLGHSYNASMPLFPGNRWGMETKPPTQVGRQTGNFEVIHGDIGQSGTQFDALGHVGIQPDLNEITWNPSLAETLYYNGFTGKQVHNEAGYNPNGLQKLGVEKIMPYFTRGILIDVARYDKSYKTAGEIEEITITVDSINRTLDAQGMSWDDITEGDVVLIRTGWEEHWDNVIGETPYYTGIAPGSQGTPGIGMDVAQKLAEKKVGCVGSDNWGVEVVSSEHNEIPEIPLPFPVHNELIVKNGIPLQENMRLKALADDLADEFVATDGPPKIKKTIYMFAYIYVPVPIQGASGSPGSPLAVR